MDGNDLPLRSVWRLFVATAHEPDTAEPVSLICRGQGMQQFVGFFIFSFFTAIHMVLVMFSF